MVETVMESARVLVLIEALGQAQTQLASAKMEADAARESHGVSRREIQVLRNEIDALKRLHNHAIEERAKQATEREAILRAVTAQRDGHLVALEAERRYHKITWGVLHQVSVGKLKPQAGPKLADARILRARRIFRA